MRLHDFNLVVVDTYIAYEWLLKTFRVYYIGYIRNINTVTIEKTYLILKNESKFWYKVISRNQT